MPELDLCKGPGANTGLFLGLFSALERHKEPGFLKGGIGEVAEPPALPKSILDLHFGILSSLCSWPTISSHLLTTGAANCSSNIRHNGRRN